MFVPIHSTPAAPSIFADSYVARRAKFETIVLWVESP